MTLLPRVRRPLTATPDTGTETSTTHVMPAGEDALDRHWMRQAIALEVAFAPAGPAGGWPVTAAPCAPTPPRRGGPPGHSPPAAFT